jgi:hypothetical protein
MELQEDTQGLGFGNELVYCLAESLAYNDLLHCVNTIP